ncbi:hypothetical protein HY478_03650 [Candidatus Uhrbacteria bacterium]|nr:hypothetical protein [Candidatus Uhrbacteria bacterium]
MQTKTIFACQKCGAQALKWAGRCFECGEWGTMSEESVHIAHRKPQTAHSTSFGRPGKVISLTDIQAVSG